MSFRDDLQTVPKIAMNIRSVLVKTVQELLVRLPLVGLHGMGGVGKTTLAKLLFNVLCAEFEYTCFVPGFMLKGDYKEMEGRVYSSMHRYGKMVTQRRQELEPGDLKGNRLLLVLDNMENEHHVELLKEIVLMNACANSRYIVTSRSLEVLDSCIAIFGRRDVNAFFQRDVDACVFDVGFLNHDNSNQLFRSHAFPYPDEPSPSMTEWIDKIVEKCEGLPLTLEVMGSYLKRDPREKVWSEKRWSQTLEALDAAENIVNFNERLWAKLQVSYNSLSPEEQEIFLDAATFFNNSHWMLFEAKACWRVLYGFEDVRWKTLVDLCIVYNVDETDRILMHEQMRSLGMKLASAWGHNRICRTWTKKNVPSTSSMKLASAWRFHRLFNWTKENEPSTSFSPGMEIEEVIALQLEDSMALNSRAIGQMKKLRYLESEKMLMLDEVFGNLSKKVVLLRVHGEVNSLHNLVDRGRECLAVLVLEAPVRCLPTTFSELQNLEIMKFFGCLFEGLPETFGQLPRLRLLTLSNCSRLRSLPEAFGRLSRLEKLIMVELHNFRRLPEGFGNLPQLQRLVLCGLSKIRSLPESFVRLSCLEDLIMMSLDNLQRLPEGFGNLSQLNVLVIEDAPYISELPESFSRLTRLQNLHLNYMPGLQALPDTFGELSQLSHLSMLRCNIKQKLPHSFGQLPMLTLVDIRGCSSLVFSEFCAVCPRIPKLRYLLSSIGGSHGTFSYCPKVAHHDDQSVSISELRSIFGLDPDVPLEDDEIRELEKKYLAGEFTPTFRFPGELRGYFDYTLAEVDFGQMLRDIGI
ncbi:hypothetical protein MPTK1_5g06300 [Marchantia polymorpha subsp. ruderalis]|uniref:NB-ARC domain-containing protein n=2 Tax=Marchantia polymorpha TaxID=3197 RepID=A0A176WGP4_MARPO|nr:hypothetical protein AXG93_110s1010 [Marchantia polymorpha subsp. ruderalis]PTQ26551.1 hypothetical protein MARPO_1012s0001 [Marchantia polymorpha]BBN10772.1 hypothetical protein Mp_5g06300 [Marchantia polymorpha subsp. ruderalis]|eukprot:PTQ26551.1 hypothetical protein MARPO_1012s0001 [Marchantia polymorpha]